MSKSKDKEFMQAGGFPEVNSNKTNAEGQERDGAKHILENVQEQESNVCLSTDTGHGQCEVESDKEGGGSPSSEPPWLMIDKYKAPEWMLDHSYRRRLRDLRAKREKIEHETGSAVNTVTTEGEGEKNDQVPPSSSMKNEDSHALYEASVGKSGDEENAQLMTEIKPRRKGTMAQLYPDEVKEILEMRKRPKPTYSLNERYGKYLNKDN